MSARDRPRVLVLGGGFGGLGAVKKLEDADADVVLIDAHDYHTFQPLLYQLATGLLEPSAVGHALRDLVHGQENATVHMTSVTAIDLEQREVQLAEMAPLTYDVLVLALGAEVNFFGTEGAAEHAFPMYTLSDAVRLKDHLLKRWEAADKDPSLVDDGALNVVVVGGGPTGVESAGAIAELYRSDFAKDYPGIPQENARVVLVEAGPTVFAMFKPNLQAYAAEALQERTVEVVTGERVASVAPTRVTLKSGTSIAAHTLVWGAGLQGNKLVQSLGLDLERGNRIAVGPDLAVAGRPDVYVVGDVAAITDAKTGQVLPQLGSVALQSGEHVGETIARRLEGQGAEALQVPRQGDDGDDRPPRGGRPDARRAHDEGHEGPARLGRQCTSRCCRPTRIAPRRSSTGRARPSRTSARDGSRSRRTRTRAGERHDRGTQGHAVLRHGLREEEEVTSAATATAPTSTTAPKVADVFVVFGITGDLAKVMTFRSLYRLEQRGLLQCPIVGVAFDDWTVDQLVQRARDSIVGTGEQLDEAVFARFAERLSYVQGDFADDAAYERVAAAVGDAEHPVFYLEIPPFLFGRVVEGLHGAGLTTNARIVVEKPFGHDQESARALAAELHQYIDESQLFRIDHYLGKMGLEEILYVRFANTHARAGLEPGPRRVRRDHDGRGLRRGGPGPLLRPGRRAARRRRQPPDAGGRGDGDGGAVARRPGDAEGRDRSRSSRRSPRPTRRTTCAASTTATSGSTASPPTRRPRRTRRSGSRSRTGAGRACRSSSAPASASRRRRPRSAWSSSARPSSASASPRASRTRS